MHLPTFKIKSVREDTNGKPHRISCLRNSILSLLLHFSDRGTCGLSATFCTLLTCKSITMFISGQVIVGHPKENSAEVTHLLQKHSLIWIPSMLRTPISLIQTYLYKVHWTATFGKDNAEINLKQKLLTQVCNSSRNKKATTITTQRYL